MCGAARLHALCCVYVCGLRLRTFIPPHTRCQTSRFLSVIAAAHAALRRLLSVSARAQSQAQWKACPRVFDPVSDEMKKKIAQWIKVALVLFVCPSLSMLTGLLRGCCARSLSLRPSCMCRLCALSRGFRDWAPIPSQTPAVSPCRGVGVLPTLIVC